MKLLHAVSFSVLVAHAALSTGCSDAHVSPPEQPAADPLAATVDALGGIDALRAIEHQRLTVEGDAFEPDQAFTPEGEPISVGSFQYEGTLAADFSRMRLDWTR